MRISSVLCLSILTSGVFAADWQQFRGGTAGKLEKISHPLEWNAQTNIAWSVPMTGSGWSSPIIIDDRIFLTAAVPADGSRPKGMMAGVSSMGTYRSAKPVNHSFVVSCLNLADGKELWNRTIEEKVPPVVHPSNTYATESPASDGERLFTFFATTGSLIAWDFDGTELWKKNVGSYKSGNGFGTGSSLAVADGRLFLQYDNDESSFVVAYDAKSGEQIWRDDRTTKTSWSSPLIWKNGDTSELVTCGAGVVTAYDPASGNVLWTLSGMESAFSASPAIGQNQMYFGKSGPGSAGPLVAIPAGIRGDVQLNSKFEADQIAWSLTKSGPGMASPVVSNGFLYIPGSGGILNCYDEVTGERIYRTRVPQMATVAASLWADDERVFILDEKGTTHVIASGPEFRVVTTNRIDDLFWSTASVADNTLLLRGAEKLYCIRK